MQGKVFESTPSTSQEHATCAEKAEVGARQGAQQGRGLASICEAVSGRSRSIYSTNV